MTPLLNILAATDFSPYSERALRRAAQLASGHGARLHLVHVIDDKLLRLFAESLNASSPTLRQQLLASARQRLEESAGQLAREFGIVVVKEMLKGGIHAQLAQYAARHAIDLSVLGAQGEHFAREVFIGSTVSRFLRKGRQATLIVRSEALGAYGRVLVAVDFSPASRLAVEMALRVVPDEAVRVLHVCEVAFESKLRFAGVGEEELESMRHQVAQDAKHKLDDFLDGMPGGAALARAVIPGQPSVAVLAEARAMDADLVVMGKRGKYELEDVLLGSLTLRMLEAMDRDLLLVAQED